jgi:hypothetical protein
MINILYKALSVLIFSIIFFLFFWPVGLLNLIIFDPLYLKKKDKLDTYFRYSDFKNFNDELNTSKINN